MSHNLSILSITLSDNSTRKVALSHDVLTLGRSQDCDITVADDSISERHLELNPTPHGCEFQDLCSSNGTFLDGEERDSGFLAPGQSLQIGSTTLQLDQWQPRDASRAEPFQEPLQTHELTRQTNLIPLPILLGEEILYPLKGTGPFILLGSFVALALISALFLLPLPFYGIGRIFILRFALGLIGIGYLYAYFKSIINTTTFGEETLPTWPDFDLSNLGLDLLIEAAQIVSLIFVCAGLALSWNFLGPDLPQKEPLLSLLILAGALYAPMALLAVSFFDHAGAAFPHIVFPAIMRNFRAYLVLLTYAAPLSYLLMVTNNHLGSHSFYALRIIALFIEYYLLIVLARWLGLFYRHRKKHFRWE